jgi:ankyrin repeat protein
MQTELYKACRKGSVDEVLNLVRHCKKEDLITKDTDGYTPLHYACASGNIKIIKELLKQLNANDINIRADRIVFGSGSTPLRIACTYHNTETMKVLILNGAYLVDNLIYNAYMRSIKWTKNDHKNVMYPPTRKNMLVCFMIYRMNMEKLQ